MRRQSTDTGENHGFSFMRPMLDFLKRPADYFSNLQTDSFSHNQSHRRPQKHKSPHKRPNKGSERPSNNGGAGGNLLSGITGILTNNPVTGAIGNILSPASGAVSNIAGDGTLSRRDFVFNLTTWFRRVIWFLGFTAATTASAPLFLLTAGLAALFELIYNVTNARQYWQDVTSYDAGFSGQ